MPSSNAQLLRRYVVTNKVVTTEQIREDLGLTLQDCSSAVETLLRKGALKRIAYGTYKWVPEMHQKSASPRGDKIWNAMRNNVVFTVPQIVQQAATTEAYVYKQLRLYQREGLVMQRGAMNNDNNTGRVKLWAMTVSGREFVQRPRLKTMEPDLLVKMVTRLNRMACSGDLRTDRDALAAASDLAGEILQELAKVGTHMDGEAA